MRKLILSLGLFTGICVVAASCLKDNSTNVPASDCSTVTTAAPVAEVAALQQYLDTNHITTTKDARGFFYSMDSTVAIDSGTHALSCSNVAVTYRGTLLNNTVFDTSYASTAVAISLSNTITGWKEAIPLMRKNAIMTLYLPPSLAYGTSANGPIPANSALVYYIKLYDFQ